MYEEKTRKAIKESVNYRIQHDGVVIRAVLHRNNRLSLLTHGNNNQFSFQSSDPVKVEKIAAAMLHAVELNNQEEWN